MKKSTELARAVIAEELARDRRTRDGYVMNVTFALRRQHSLDAPQPANFDDPPTTKRYADAVVSNLFPETEHDTMRMNAPVFADEDKCAILRAAEHYYAALCDAENELPMHLSSSFIEAEKDRVIGVISVLSRGDTEPPPQSIEEVIDSLSGDF